MTAWWRGSVVQCNVVAWYNVMWWRGSMVQCNAVAWRCGKRKTPLPPPVPCTPAPPTPRSPPTPTLRLSRPGPPRPPPPAPPLQPNGNNLDPYYYLNPGETMDHTWCDTPTYSSDPSTPDAVPHVIATSVYHAELPYTNKTFPPWNTTTTWVNNVNNFDDIIRALWTLYQVGGWVGGRG